MTPLSISTGDQYTLTADIDTTATVSNSITILTMNGGQCTITGNDHKVTIGASCGSSCNFPVFADVSSMTTQLTITRWVFSVNSPSVILFRGQNTQQITFSSCKFTGVAAIMGFFYQALQVTYSNCIFENSEEQANSFYPTYGSMLAVDGCTQFTVTGSSFTNITAASYNTAVTPSSAGARGYAAPVVITSSMQTSFTNVSFTDCTGGLTGGIFSYSAGIQNTYTGLSFKNNKAVIPPAQVSAVLSAPETNPTTALEISSFFTGTPTLGNDLTTKGSTAVTVTGACSTSAPPHSTSGDFEECTDADAASAPLRAPSALLVCALALGVALLTLMGRE